MSLFRYKNCDETIIAKIEQLLIKTGSITYYDMCDMLGVDYNKDINDALLMYNNGLIDWKEFCNEIDRIKSEAENGNN